MGFSAAAITTAMAAASAAVGTASAVQQQQQRLQEQEQQKDMARYSASLAQEQAAQAEAAGRTAKQQAYEQATQKRQQAAGIIATQRALQGAGGAQVEQGSNLDATLDTAEKGEIDALAVQQKGLDADHAQRLEAWRWQEQAKAGESKANFLADAQQGAALATSATLLNGLERTGKNFYRLTSSGMRA